MTFNIRFYYASGANCCERVRWALDYKRVPYELIDLGSSHNQEHWFRISPFGRVPVMEINGAPLTESMAMLEFLEEISPDMPLNYHEHWASNRIVFRNFSCTGPICCRRRTFGQAVRYESKIRTCAAD